MAVSDKNKKVYIKLKFFGLVLISFILFFSIFSSASAAPIVPCGLSKDDPETLLDETVDCTTCHFFILGQNVNNFIFEDLVPPVAIIFVVIGGGFILLAGGSSAARAATGIGLIKTTGTGVAIIFVAWVVVNTTLSQTSKFLADDQGIIAEIKERWYKFPIYCGVGASIPPSQLQCSPANATEIINEQGKASITLNARGGSSYTWSVQSNPNLANVNFINGTNNNPQNIEVDKIGDYIFKVTDSTNSATCGVKVDDNVCPNCIAAHCSDVNLDFCGPIEDSSGCFESNVNALFNEHSSELSSVLSRYSLGGSINTEKFIKALMARLSGGQVNVQANGRFGLFQFRPSDVNHPSLKSSCGISGNIDKSWLIDEENISASTCLALEWIKSKQLLISCLNTRDLAAGFLAGDPGVCQPSIECRAPTSGNLCEVCSGRSEPVKKWECLWQEGTNHKTCTDSLPVGGDRTFYELRLKAPRIQACYNKF